MPASSPLASGTAGIIPVGPIVPGLLELDELGLLVGLAATALIALLILCSPATGQTLRYTLLSLLFLPVALATLAASSVPALFVGWELSALFAWGLGRLADSSADEGAVPYSPASALASLLMLGGLLGLATASRTADLAGLRVADGGLLSLAVLAAICLKALGMLAEVGPRPGRGPGRLSLAGATVGGAGLLVVGLFPALRLFGPVAGASPAWRWAAAGMVGGLALLAVLAALGHHDYLRAIAWGALSQLGALTCALLVGPREAAASVLLGALLAALATAGLALCAGAVEAATGERSLRRVGGLAQRLPGLALLFALLGAAAAGLPPFGGFVAAGLLGVALWGHAAPSWALLLAAVGTLQTLHFARLFVRLFLGELRAPSRPGVPWPAPVAAALLLACLAAAGAFPEQALALVGPALGGPPT